MLKIGIITVWFGKLPSYFPLWVKSLVKNKNFDFIIFTDQILDSTIRPLNLKVINISFDDLKLQISSRLDLNLSFNKAYKFCDFKPAYGEIFSENLLEYDFWGYCDLDMIFGDLNNFFNNDFLSKHKKILNRGHLTLYKNEKNINQLYRKSLLIDYKKVFESPDYCLFDEWLGVYKIFKEFGIEQYHEEIIADINANSSRFTCTNLKNYKNQIFLWSNGKVYHYFVIGNTVKSKELAYIHFQKRIMKVNDENIYNNSSFIINSFGFFNFNGVITSDVIKNYDQINYRHYLLRQFRRVCMKLPFINKRYITFNKSYVIQ